MSVYEPGPQVRLKVASWPENAPRGAVARFCRENGVSRSWFYKVRAKALAEGTWAAMELGSHRPATNPAQTPEDVSALAVKIRRELAADGKDCGPLSVAALMRRRGLAPPSRATLARIFTRAGEVVPAPKKKPRSAYKRFAAAAPNELWQIDATEWAMPCGGKAVIFQVIDDHSRLALASLAARGETSEAAIAVVKAAVARHGAPRKFLSDNGLALNPSRRGYRGALVAYLESLGTRPITGKPHKPTTQGKNERFHQTLFKYLSARPEQAATLAQLQAQIDAFDLYYNTEREHQAHGALHLTPLEAWELTPKAEPPIPPQPAAAPLEPEITLRTASRPKGIVTILNCHFLLGAAWAGKVIRVVHDATTVAFFDEHGTQILTHPRPPRGTTFVPRSGLKHPAPAKASPLT